MKENINRVTLYTDRIDNLLFTYSDIIMLISDSVKSSSSVKLKVNSETSIVWLNDYQSVVGKLNS